MSTDRIERIGHMEFTHEIIAAGIEDAGGEIRGKGRFVRSAAEPLAYDCTGLNRRLSRFPDAMAADYTAKNSLTRRPPLDSGAARAL